MIPNPNLSLTLPVVPQLYSAFYLSVIFHIPQSAFYPCPSVRLLFRTQDPTAQQCIKHSGEARAPNSTQNGMLLTPPDVTMHPPSWRQIKPSVSTYWDDNFLRSKK